MQKLLTNTPVYWKHSWFPALQVQVIDFDQNAECHAFK